MIFYTRRAIGRTAHHWRARVPGDGNGDKPGASPEPRADPVEIVWVTDADGRSYYRSPSWYEYVGEAVGSARTDDDALRFYHPEDRALLKREWTKALEASGAYRYGVRVRIRRSDGAYRWFRVEGQPSTNAAGAARWVITSVSVDERIPAGPLAQGGRYGIRLAVERFGSLSHLAAAMGVEPERLQRWLRGAEEVPAVDYTRMILLVADQG